MENNTLAEFFNVLINLVGEKYSNDVFLLNPPCDCYDAEPEHVCPVNFWYIPLDFTVSWYKHPGRCLEANITIEKRSFVLMVEDCMKSIAQENFDTLG